MLRVPVLSGDGGPPGPAVAGLRVRAARDRQDPHDREEHDEREQVHAAERTGAG